MAEYMTITSRFSSWKEYYLSKKKETGGFLHQLAENKRSLLNYVPRTFVGHPAAFKKVIEDNGEENFLLLPAGGNRVNIVHNCFTLDGEHPQLRRLGFSESGALLPSSESTWNKQSRLS
jgi:hypothetical protein